MPKRKVFSEDSEMEHIVADKEKKEESKSPEKNLRKGTVILVSSTKVFVESNGVVQSIDKTEKYSHLKIGDETEF